MPTLDEIAAAIAPDAFADWQAEATAKGMSEDNPGRGMLSEHYGQRQQKAREAAQRVTDLLAK